jgi:hypothetical protein
VSQRSSCERERGAPFRFRDNGNNRFMTERTHGDRRRQRRRRSLFLRWALVNALATVAFVAAAISYHGEIHVVGRIAAAIVLAVFALASAYCGVLAWRAGDSATRHLDQRSLEHVALAIRVCPMLAMLGTASGFLIAFAGSVDDVQQRVAGASTGIVATVVGVACTIVLMLERHLLDERK